MHQFSILLLALTFIFPQLVFGNSVGNHNKVFTPASKMSESDWLDASELKRTWEAALVRIPRLNGSYSSYTMNNVPKHSTKISRTFPTIIYLHGCAGVWAGTHIRLNFLAKSGYAVIAPVSFARAKYPQSCDSASAKGGMYRGTLSMRQNDAGYAISNAKKLKWVDKNNIFLMGHSQGGITTATFKSKDEAKSVNARVIEGWTCHAGWAEYKGINAPANEPVLALVAKNDPWFQNAWNRGNCGVYMNKHNGSRSIVLSEGVLNARHELLEDRNLQKKVLEFLQKNQR